jgi:hypothetical protein
MRSLRVPDPLVVFLSLVPFLLGFDAGVEAAPAVNFAQNKLISAPDPDGVTQNETAIAVNPTNPDNLVAVFQGLSRSTDRVTSCFFTSTADGGKTWQAAVKASLEASGDICFDPFVSADAEGNFYFSFLDGRVTDPSIVLVSGIDLVVAKSTDGGRTFSSLSIAVLDMGKDPNSIQPDKPAIGIDTGAGSPFRGTIYAGFTDILSFQAYEVAVVVSRDGGATWSAPLFVTPTHGNEKQSIARVGALPVVGPGGTAYIFYAEYAVNTGPLGIRFVKSDDGGTTWSSPADVAADLPSPGCFRLKNADPQFGTLANRGFKANSLPSAAVAPDGTLYATWTDFPAGSCVNDGTGCGPCTNPDLRLSVSRNDGLTWTAPVKVTDATVPTDHFFPWIATHPDGRASIIWQDRRFDPSNINYDTFYTSTFDGMHFSPDVRVTTATSTLGTITFLGDYIGLAATANKIFPTWTDTRSGNPDIFTAAGKLP